MHHRLYSALMMLMASVIVSAQLGPTVTGFVYDKNSRELKPIVGIPGSAYLGAPVVGELDGAWSAPSGKFGVARRGDQTVVLNELNRPTPIVIEDSRLLGQITSVVWSVTSNTAVLYSSVTQQFQRVHVNDNSADVEPPFDGSHLGSTLTGLAIHSDGRVAIAFDQGQIYIARPTEALSRVATIDGLTALAFTASGDQLYVTSTTSLKVLNTAGEPSMQNVVDGLSNPVGLTVRMDGIYVATDGDNKIRRFDSNGHADFEQNLDQKPDGIVLLQDGAILLLNRATGKKPAIIVDTRNQPSVFFIPNSAGSSL